jgi:hypothetical protein
MQIRTNASRAQNEVGSTALALAEQKDQTKAIGFLKDVMEKKLIVK